jgi:hypothetical protein
MSNKTGGFWLNCADGSDRIATRIAVIGVVVGLVFIMMMLVMMKITRFSCNFSALLY